LDRLQVVRYEPERLCRFFRSRVNRLRAQIFQRVEVVRRVTSLPRPLLLRGL